MSEKTFSPVAQSVCDICSLIWIVAVFGACTYIVFWKDASGWWYALALLIASSWTCKWVGSPEQIRAREESE